MSLSILEFDPTKNKIFKKKRLTDGLSVSVQIENTLWVTNDETVSLERLSFQNRDGQGNYHFGEHMQFPLSEYLTLPIVSNEEGKPEEIDIEGLDCKDGYLWLVGSHSAKREKADRKDRETNEERLEKLLEVTRKGNRFLIAKIPVVRENETYVLKKTVEEDGKMIRVARQLEGDMEDNKLTEALRRDPLLKMFMDIPGKDNGFDIEGLAVAGDKVFVGLRGPVLRGWAIILELALDETDQGAGPVLTLTSYNKHVLPLDGLGIRDICVQGADLLILAGPTMDLDGPVAIFRWVGGVNAGNESVDFSEVLQKVLDVPFGKGDDHAEGMTLFSSNGGSEPDSIMIVYDSASAGRKVKENSLVADVFALT